MEEKPVRTPWGVAEGAKDYAKGITFYETPGHGGFKLSKTRNNTVPNYMRKWGGWYEEDSHRVIVELTFPEIFTEADRDAAKAELRSFDPEAYKQFCEDHPEEVLPK